MIEVNALTFTLLSEGFAVLCLALIVIVVLTVRRKNKERKAAKQLIDSIKNHADQRLADIKSYVEATASLEGEALLKASKTIDRKEKDFITKLVRLYIKKDNEQFVKMGELLDSVVASYKAHAASQDGSSDDQVEEHEKLIDSLKSENSRLIEELKITKSTMANMMAEFNHMFNGGGDDIEASKDSLKTTMAEVSEEDATVSPEQSMAMSEVESDETSLDTQSAPETTSSSASTPVAPASESTDASNADIDDIFFSANDDPEVGVASAPTSMSDKKESDFGDIVSSDDVDDLFDSIDLSEEIDVK